MTLRFEHTRQYVTQNVKTVIFLQIQVQQTIHHINCESYKNNTHNKHGISHMKIVTANVF